MTCPCSRSRFRWLRQFCSLICLFAGCCSLPSARAQNLDKPLQNIDEEVTAFAFAPDGRIVYSVYRKLKTKAYDALEHDDIWLQEAGGQRRRILEGQKYTRGNQTFSYLIDSFRWSPNGHFILAQMFTTTVESDSGNGVDSYQTLVFDDSGREVRIAKGDNVILDAGNATFLPDNATIFYLSEALKPLPLFAIKCTRLATGSFPSFFEGRTFRDVAWLKDMNFAIAVEQDRSLSGPPRLQHFDLFSEDHQELATLDGYEGGLSVSPSRKKVAYFIDKEVLEIRDLASPNRVARIRIGLGIFRWSPDESRILLKRALEKKSGDLVWIALPPLAVPAKGQDIPVSQPEPSPIFRGISFRQFDISPDGRFLAVTLPGKRNLLIFPLPLR
jgi:dipeptidyl aminopeptidase/acylaminoacyl peptidase